MFELDGAVEKVRTLLYYAHLFILQSHTLFHFFYLENFGLDLYRIIIIFSTIR